MNRNSVVNHMEKQQQKSNSEVFLAVFLSIITLGMLNRNLFILLILHALNFCGFFKILFVFLLIDVSEYLKDAVSE